MFQEIVLPFQAIASVHSEKAKPQAFVSLLADRQRDSAVKVHLQRTDYTTGPKEF